MKTTCLIKAQVGMVKHVIEPNKEGYCNLMDLPVGDITLQVMIDGMKRAIETQNKTIESQADLIKQLRNNEIVMVQKLESLESDILKLKSYEVNS